MDQPLPVSSKATEPSTTATQEFTGVFAPKPYPSPARTPWVLIVAVSLIAGIVGGLASRGGALPKWLSTGFPEEQRDLTPQSNPALQAVAPEDEKIVSMVERSTPAVVSIVITKDVPKYRNFFRSPFGFSFPFFDDQSLPQSPQGEVNQTQKQQVGSGSGFLISADGYIVTNKHVVSDNSAEYTVILSDEKEYPATVLALAPNNDIAVIKIEGANLPFLRLGDSDTLRVGQTVIAIGNPLGEFANSVSRGIISGLKRSVTAGSGYGDTETLNNIIQTDAAINPGNSGGPLFNIEGEVIGINVAVAQGAENIGFALPVNSIKRVVEEVKTTGKLSTPYIGVRYVVLDKEVAQQYGLDVDHGALILRGERITDLAVVPGSPADKAGLVENDIILEIDGKKIDTENTLGSIIAEKRVGDEIILKVWHKGDIKEVKVRLEERKQTGIKE